MHPVNITNIERVLTNYTVISKTDSGPAVVTHMHTVAVQFYLSKQFEATIQILRNWVEKNVTDILNNGRRDLSAQDAEVYKTKRFKYEENSQIALERVESLRMMTPDSTYRFRCQSTLR